MRKWFFVVILFSNFGVFAQIRVASWNLCDMGKSKSDAEISFMARTISGYDVVALQEIVASPEGAKAVAKLVSKLNQTGAKWDFCLSDPTSGSPASRERYAFVWKTASVKKNKDWLDAFYEKEIDREPYMCIFTYKNRDVTLVNFHAVSKKKQPETEIKYFKFFGKNYPGQTLVFMGDFNCAQSHSVFGPMKTSGYAAALIKVKTTLKMVCKGGCTASEYDNFFYPKETVSVKTAGLNLFYKSFPDLKKAREISDHLPVWMDFDWVYGKP